MEMEATLDTARLGGRSSGWQKFWYFRSDWKNHGLKHQESCRKEHWTQERSIHAEGSLCKYIYDTENIIHNVRRFQPHIMDQKPF